VQPLFVGHRGRLAELAARHRLPLIANRREFAVAGALAAYAVSGAWQIRRLAFYVDKILKGAKPRDLPVEQPGGIQVSPLARRFP
jgi:putative tryptophan/tyrosine transport system substrate-binding protein